MGGVGGNGGWNVEEDEERGMKHATFICSLRIANQASVTQPPSFMQMAPSAAAAS